MEKFLERCKVLELTEEWIKKSKLTYKQRDWISNLKYYREKSRPRLVQWGILPNI
jgi:hypothetical protein